MGSQRGEGCDGVSGGKGEGVCLVKAVPGF